MREHRYHRRSSVRSCSRLQYRSPRQERAFAAIAILKDRELLAVQSFQLRAIEHGAHLAIGNALALSEQKGAIRGAHCLVGVMRREQHALARRAKRPDLSHHPPLIAKIEARGRLIQHDELRLLRQRTRQEGKLSLATGNLGVRTISQMRDPKTLEHASRDRAVGRARAAEE